MVPVGGAIVASSSEEFIAAVSQTYPGKRITWLEAKEMGERGWSLGIAGVNKHSCCDGRRCILACGGWIFSK